MNTAEFTALLLLLTAMTFSPGPNTALSTALGANHGWRGALPFACAVPLGWGVLLAASALGVGGLLLAMPWLAKTVKAAGVGYLLWLAWRMTRVRQLGATDAPLRMGFWQGAALQLVNLKAWMLALTLVSGWISGRPDAGLRFVQVLPALLAFAFFSNLSYAAIGSLLRHWLTGPHGSHRRLFVFNRVMAAVLAATAGWMGMR